MSAVPLAAGVLVAVAALAFAEWAQNRFNRWSRQRELEARMDACRKRRVS